jgi:CRP-like cAMP-binding protein
MGVPSIAIWNLLFAGINAAWAVVILRQRRRVAVPADLQPTYVRHFAAMTPQEFLRLWKQGRREVVHGQRLASDGQFPDALYFLMAGTARVSRNGAPITDLAAGHFVAEMSLLTGDRANADVDAVGEIETIRWAMPDLRAIRDRNPLLWTKIQSVIGHDIVEKLQRAGTEPAVAPR